VTATVRDDRTVQLNASQFATLLSRDPRLTDTGSDVPIVLLISFAARDDMLLPLLVAQVTGRITYAHSGPVELLPDPTGARVITDVATDYSTNRVAPAATRALVRNPATRARHWSSTPISAPRPSRHPARTASDRRGGWLR
jgi:hypothetical protein